MKPDKIRFKKSHFSRIKGIFLLFLLLLILIQGIDASKNTTWITITCRSADDESGDLFLLNGTLYSSPGIPLADRIIRYTATSSGPVRSGNGTVITTNTDPEGNYFFTIRLTSTEPVRVISYEGEPDLLPSSVIVPCKEPQPVQKTPLNYSGKKTSVSLENAVQKPETGAIMAAIEPAGANIYIDTICYGTAPKLIANITPGAHDVVFVKSGYANLSIGTYVTAGKTSQIQSALNPAGSIFGRSAMPIPTPFPFNGSDSETYILIRNGDITEYTLQNASWITSAPSHTLPGRYMSSLLFGSNATGFVTTISGTRESMKRSTITFGEPHS
ncbi:MAG: PEGA domain-containing protein [Methanospirillaceae archaeon]|nr:PEGA domain-containing protein [Methanospirillaceae archaeon]